MTLDVVIRAAGVIPINATRPNGRELPTGNQRGNLMEPIRGHKRRRELPSHAQGVVWSFFEICHFCSDLGPKRTSRKGRPGGLPYVWP